MTYWEGPGTVKPMLISAEEAFRLRSSYVQARRGLNRCQYQCHRPRRKCAAKAQRQIGLQLVQGRRTPQDFSAGPTSHQSTEKGASRASAELTLLCGQGTKAFASAIVYSKPPMYQKRGESRIDKTLFSTAWERDGTRTNVAQRLD